MRRLSLEIRAARHDDSRSMLILYKYMARRGGGVAKAEDEITEEFIFAIMDKAFDNGVFLVAFDTFLNIVVGCIHASKPDLRKFDHVLNEVTLLVHPSFQDKGLGKALLSNFLDLVENNHGEILRIELLCGEINVKAIALFEKFGFIREGRFERRAKNSSETLKADIAMVWYNPTYKGCAENIITQTQHFSL
jgi:RimJ/RimL family protein N-acetyltransferase